MLKNRIIPTLLYKEPTLVKGISFNSWRRVGSLMQAIKVYNMREVDELVFFDISATKEGRSPDLQLIDDFADECFVPLTIGGGVRTIDDVRNLLKVGADKVSLNTAAVKDPGLISQVADKFGSQCVVVAIDVKITADHKYEVFINSGSEATGLDPVEQAIKVEALGAGELIVTSIDRDGTMQGYDVELINKITGAVSIPVIASGGAGNYEHMAKALVDGKASAVAAASMFHFTEQTPLGAKQYLKERGINVRL